MKASGEGSQVGGFRNSEEDKRSYTLDFEIHVIIEEPCRSPFWKDPAPTPVPGDVGVYPTVQM